MPRFYCDYCDAYLTHDSMTGRQQHMRGSHISLFLLLSKIRIFFSGWKHRENFKNHYQAYYPTWLQEQQALQIRQMQQFQMMHPMFMPPFMPPGMDMSQMMAMGMGFGGPNAQPPTDQGAPQLPPPMFRPPPSVAPPTTN